MVAMSDKQGYVPYIPDPDTWFQTPHWPDCFPWKCKYILEGKVITRCGRTFDPEEVYMLPFDMTKLKIIYGGGPHNRFIRCVENEEITP